MFIVKTFDCFQTFPVHFCSFVDGNTFGLCQENIPFILLLMKKHMSLPDGIKAIHVTIEKPGHDRVPGIGRGVQGIVHHTMPQGGKGTDADHPLQQRVKGIKADHVLVQNRGKDLGTADLIQGTIDTNKRHYRSQSRSCSKARGSRRVVTSPHHSYSCKGSTSSTSEHRKYRSRSSSRHKNGTSRDGRSHSGTWWERDRSPSPSPRKRKRHQSRSRSRSK